MEHIPDDKHSDFIAMCVNAMKAVPDYLSHHQNIGAIDTIENTLGGIKSLCKAIISAVMTDGWVP